MLSWDGQQWNHWACGGGLNWFVIDQPPPYVLLWLIRHLTCEAPFIVFWLVFRVLNRELVEIHVLWSLLLFVLVKADFFITYQENNSHFSIGWNCFTLFVLFQVRMFCMAKWMRCWFVFLSSWSLPFYSFLLVLWCASYFLLHFQEYE